MSVMNKEIYAALLDAGASEEKATEAAVAVEHADLDKRMAIVGTKLSTIEKMLWMVIAGIIALILKAFFPI